MRFLLCVLGAGTLFGADLAPGKMAKIGTVDERFQSYNVEMVEVTGGRFWAPYSAAKAATEAPKASPLAGPAIDPSMFRMRPPTDLANARLRMLAAALGPAYVRVSGTWANSTYFQDSDDPAPSSPPEGFGAVLTRKEWKGVIDFAKAVDAKIVTSFAISSGVRDANGLWTPGQARKFIEFTHAAGGSIAAAEYFNEPSFAAMGGAPKGYNAAAYGRDMAVFLPFARKAAPGMIVLGPGSVGEGGLIAGSGMPIVKSEDMLKAMEESKASAIDAFSYHFYGGVSKRCGAMGGPAQASPEQALTQDWLGRTERDEAFYGALRDRFEPGKPMWLTETAETACGGDPWASSYIDTFRYVEQLGRLAKHGVQVVAHNTLAASDYALLDETSLDPRPDYWAALLWHRLMGRTVLDVGASPTAGVDVFAHCMAGHPGGVTVLAVNTDRAEAHELTVPIASERYTLSAADLLGAKVELNGKTLQLAPGGAMPELAGVRSRAGAVKLAPATITFLAMPKANNASCR
ncbi:MAG TPA: hypothetical protein VGL53_07805 [Bryobacteraceae bacterium]|jgi:hypothetical protein